MYAPKICGTVPPRRYVGVMHMEFLQYLSSMGVAVSPNVTTGNGMDFLIGRISYTFGLTGPCLRCSGRGGTCCLVDSLQAAQLVEV